MNKQLERIRLRILAALSIVSISVCVITFFLWPLSYATGVQVSLRNGAGTRYAILTTPGQIGWVRVVGEPRNEVELLTVRSRSFSATEAVATDPFRWFWTPPQSYWFGSTEGATTINYQEVKAPMAVQMNGGFMPIWLVSLLTFAGPTWWYLARRRREYRLDHGLCMYCGTDMSASPYRCPACGKEQPW